MTGHSEYTLSDIQDIKEADTPLGKLRAHFLRHDSQTAVY